MTILLLLIESLGRPLVGHPFGRAMTRWCHIPVLFIRTLSSFNTFGELLKHLRRRARLTQKELGIAAGYSKGHITRLESGHRLPDPEAVRTVLAPALHLEREPELLARLVELAEHAHDEPAPSAASERWPR